MSDEDRELPAELDLRKDGDRIDAAYLAVKCGRHVDDAIRVVFDLMRNCRRETVRLRAASMVIDWAAGIDPGPDTPRTEAPRVFVVVNNEGGNTSVSAELRKRKAAGELVEAIATVKDPEQGGS